MLFISTAKEEEIAIEFYSVYRHLIEGRPIHLLETRIINKTEFLSFLEKVINVSNEKEELDESDDSDESEEGTE